LGQSTQPGVCRAVFACAQSANARPHARRGDRLVPGGRHVRLRRARQPAGGFFDHVVPSRERKVDEQRPEINRSVAESANVYTQ
jgi:hypothetical protein